MAPLADTERRDFLEICDDRYGIRSTVLTSQVPLTHWRNQIADPTVADSILDRLVHNAHRIELKGASMRKAKNGKPSDDKSNAWALVRRRVHDSSVSCSASVNSSSAFGRPVRIAASSYTRETA